MTHHRHEFPFGAQLQRDGGVVFTLWAPTAKRVELMLDDVALAMDRRADGWFMSLAPTARAGSRYRYRIDDDIAVPDPASRFQPDDVHGASAVVDPCAYHWGDDAWRGRAWHETVIYELHIGTFTPSGDFVGVQARLDYLVALGVTALELMPIADFPGHRNWGYDGVLAYAPDSQYGTPEALKALVDAAHARGLMVFLDVVYNHFGPEGNYLARYAPAFFSDEHRTLWGPAFNFDGADSHWVREFFIHNALYWLTEYRFDGLRLDAVHAIVDRSTPHFLQELAARVAAGPGRERTIHLILEDDVHAASPRISAGYAAQWYDPVHHSLHAAITGERHGYYEKYAARPAQQLAAALTDDANLAPTTRVIFLQNHDQVGNRAHGERIAALASPTAAAAAAAVVLLSPTIPLIFMGEECASRQPFPFFCDFDAALAQAVRVGRRREFAAFPEFNADDLPDPNAAATMSMAILSTRCADGAHEHYRDLLALRAQFIVPMLASAWRSAHSRELGADAIAVSWQFVRARLTLLANLGTVPVRLTQAHRGRVLFASDRRHTPLDFIVLDDLLSPWTVVWLLESLDERPNN